MLTYPNRSDQKRRAVIIIYEKVICFVTALCYSSCYGIDERVTVFCIRNSLFDFYLRNVYLKKKKALISVWSPWMHCIIPVIGPIAVIIQQNIEQFSKKHYA